MKKLINILLVQALLAGLSLLLYPTVSDYWNSLHASQAVASYDEAVQSMDAGRYDALLQSAQRYNRDLFSRGSLFSLTDEQREDYLSQLSIDTSGIMGYIEIPTIKVSLPIYHGTSEEVLMAGVGHLEGTSLPVGGTSTHCVLTAHSGMRNLSMFDDIHSLEPGDLVLLHTMNKTLAYKMVDSEVVLPEEMESLTIEPGADKVTLVTCTPYGVNDHRLLVHCVRTKYSKKEVDKQKSLAGRHWGKREFAVLIVVVAIVLLLLDIVIHAVRKRRKAKVSA